MAQATTGSAAGSTSGGGAAAGRRSRLALIAAALGGLGVFDVALGPLLVHAGLIAPLFGFQFFFLLGILEGIVGGLLGLVAVYRTRPGAGRAGRGLAWFAVAAGALLLVLLVRAVQPGAGLPPINDITTDLADPPAFASDPADRGRDMSYPADFVVQVRAAYPDLQPALVDAPPAEALARAEATARELGWEVVAVDPDAGTLLARETTPTFLFVDDVLVRVRPEGTGSRVDVRSKSRDGRGDLGANAARIRRFLAALPR